MYCRHLVAVTSHICRGVAFGVSPTIISVLPSSSNHNVAGRVLIGLM